MFCWWRHNRVAMTSQWPENCDANTWQVISNPLDIDFIHGDIHSRSCKKLFLYWVYCTAIIHRRNIDSFLLMKQPWRIRVIRSHDPTCYSCCSHYKQNTSIFYLEYRRYSSQGTSVALNNKTSLSITTVKWRCRKTLTHWSWDIWMWS